MHIYYVKLSWLEGRPAAIAASATHEPSYYVLGFAKTSAPERIMRGAGKVCVCAPSLARMRVRGRVRPVYASAA